MSNPVGFVTLRSAKHHPAKAAMQRPLLTVVPIAHDPNGRPTGVRLSLVSEQSITWVDVGAASAHALMAQIQAALGGSS